MNEVDVLVIGAGMAGVTAALRASDLGRSVAIVSRGPLGSSLWSGVGDIFGRTSAGPREQLSSRVRRSATCAEASESLSAEERMSRVVARFPDHPYVRLGLSPERLSGLVDRAVQRLEIPGRIHAFPPLLPTMSGTVRRGDFVCEGIATLDRKLRFLGLEEWPTWDPTWMARVASRSAGLAFEHAWAGPSDFLAATPLQVAAKWDAPEPGRLAAIAEASANSAVVVPAVLGTSFEARTQTGEALRALGVDASELVGTADSVFGLRLVRRLATLLDRAGIATIESAGPLESADGGLTYGDWRAAAAVVATGSQPRTEWQARLWTASGRPPRNTAPSPWLEQSFLMDGVRFSESLAVNGHAQLFAAGACLDGHDFVHDGTGFGVALATGWLAGEHAAEAAQ